MLANVAVFVSGGGTNLQALIDFWNSGKLKHGNIKIVVSNKEDAYALKRAQEANIKTCVISKKAFSAEEFEKKLYDTMLENDIDIIVLAGFVTACLFAI